MGLITEQAAKRFFGRQHHDNAGRISPYLNRIMGPDFAGYLIDRDAHRAVLEALPFERLSISAEDGAELAAHWYQNPVPTERTAVLIHGHGSCGFEGYASVGLEYIRRGYNILLPDNRACGESGGEVCTFGILESRDSLRWVREALRRRPRDSIVLHGCSLGAAAVCMMTCMDLPSAVRAAVSDCSYADAVGQIGRMIRLAYLPEWPLLHLEERWFQRHAGMDLHEACPLEAVRRAEVPILFIHGGSDHYVPPGDARLLYEACSSEKELLLVKGAGHAASHYADRDGYCRALFGFLESHLKESAE